MAKTYVGTTHLINMSGEAQWFDGSGRVLVFNPNPEKAKPEDIGTYGLVRSDPIEVASSKEGKKYKVPGPLVLKKISDKPGPYKHYVNESEMQILNSGTYTKGGLKNQDSSKLVPVDTIVETYVAKLGEIESQVASLEQQKLDGLRELEAIQAQIKAASASLASQSALKELKQLNKA